MLRVIEAIKVFHKLLHLELVDAFVPDRVPAGKQVEQDDATGPDVGLLRISEHVRYLLRRLVQKGAALGEVGDGVQRILDRQTEVYELHLVQVFVAAKNQVVWLDIPMNDILVIVHVLERSEQSLHDLGSLVLRQTLHLSKLLLVFHVARHGLLAQLHAHHHQVFVLDWQIMDPYNIGMVHFR